MYHISLMDVPKCDVKPDRKVTFKDAHMQLVREGVCVVGDQIRAPPMTGKDAFLLSTVLFPFKYRYSIS